jgi:flagellar hook-associated protein 3 FlgL
MRISTSQFYSQGSEAITRQQSELARTQQQISGGKTMLAPADDPVGAARAAGLTQARALTNQYAANIGSAQDALNFTDSTLGQVTDVVQTIRELAVNAGDGTMTDADRSSLATQLAGSLQQLIGLANTRDATNGYLFGGFATTGAPFAAAPGGAVYSGDQGQRALQVAPGRTLEISENGASIFEATPTGNGTFAASAASGNAGTGVISSGNVADATAVTGDAYQLKFGTTGGVTTYDVVDSTSGATVSTGNAFAAGQAITVGGMQVAITGAPASGDTFALAPAPRQSLFTTIQNLVDTLKTPATTAAGRAQLANGLSAALANIDQGLNTVLTVRAGVGARLAELDALSTGNTDAGTQIDASLSSIQDLDYAKAMSAFSQQQLALTAAQKSFAQVSSLSLFNYIQ